MLRLVPRLFPSLGFGLLLVVGLAMAAVAAGCIAGQQSGPEDPTNTDPAHAERVEPDHPLGDAGASPSPLTRSAPAPQPPEPRPTPRRDPKPDPLPEPNPIPDRTPEPVPEPNPTPH
jgi:outer membrane biosynthesis protein TonB